LLMNVKLNDGVFTIPKKVVGVYSNAFAEIEGLTTIDFSKAKITYLVPYLFKGFEEGTIIVKKGSDFAKSIENEGTAGQIQVTHVN